MERNYSHRTFGDIGKVELVAPKGKWTMDGKELPESSVSHLVMFALQTLQDAYAGAKTAEDAIAAFETKRTRLIEGTIGTRGTGDGVTERQRVARIVVRNAVKAKVGGTSDKWKAFAALDTADQNEKLDAWFAANEATFNPAVDAEMARRAEAAAAKGALASGLDIEL